MEDRTGELEHKNFEIAQSEEKEEWKRVKKVYVIYRTPTNIRKIAVRKRRIWEELENLL